LIKNEITTTQYISDVGQLKNIRCWTTKKLSTYISREMIFEHLFYDNFFDNFLSFTHIIFYFIYLLL